MMIETTFLKDFGYIFRKKIREKHNLLHEDKITGESRDDEITHIPLSARHETEAAA